MDLLVRLYDLPPQIAVEDVNVRRAFAAEKGMLSEWVAANFGQGWASECEIAFTHQPLACFVATCRNDLLGFACYDATARGFFGPTGVLEVERGQGIGRAVLLATLHDMAANGYGYAIIGGVSSAEFYRNAVQAMEIPDSTPGFYRDLLRYPTNKR